MKTKEELNAVKDEVETVSVNFHALNEKELKQVSGGDIEITYDVIMECIDAGNERMAAGYFNLVQYSLPSLELYKIRMAFLSKFGYPIEMFVE